MRKREHLARVLDWIVFRICVLGDAFEQRFLTEDEIDRMSDRRMSSHNAWAEKQDAKQGGTP